jgi:predicted metal-dependent enzyme (double-stranded beta helix superfamily)
MPAPAAVVTREHLIPRLREAVELGDTRATAERIKDDLTELIDQGAIQLPERFYQAVEGGYARRLLHRDPDGKFTAVVMTWGPGQRTALHDHAGIWCVEGVVAGTMTVEQFELMEEREDGLCRFESRGQVLAGRGSSGALIPPFEYHILGNARVAATAVTLHVYGGEMDHCSIFEPAEGGHRRVSKQLSYDD